MVLYGIIGIRLKEEGLDIKNFFTIASCCIFVLPYINPSIIQKPISTK